MSTPQAARSGAANRRASLVSRVTPELFLLRQAPTETADLERIRSYEIKSGGKTYKVYRGDTHRHTEFSMDGNNDGSLFQTYRYAIDAASLDYLLVSEHNSNAGPDKEYINWLLQQAVDVHTIPGRFQPFYGYERSISYPDGHRNILFSERGNPTLPITQAEGPSTRRAPPALRVPQGAQRHRHLAHLGDRDGHGLARQRPRGRAARRDLPGRPRLGGVRGRALRRQQREPELGAGRLPARRATFGTPGPRATSSASRPPPTICQRTSPTPARWRKSSRVSLCSTPCGRGTATPPPTT